MSIRNLDAVFRPRSIALFGASERAGSIGDVVRRNLLAGGFAGQILLVNPKYRNIDGREVYPDVAHLPLVPDLAVICTPPQSVPGLIAELGRRGTKGAVVITAGFKELGNDTGKALEQAMLSAAKPHLLRIVGPNCVGILSSETEINASFAPARAQAGTIAVVAQSGALVTTILDWASEQHIGFSHLVSLGDMADVDFGDMLDYLAADPKTSAILLYVEAITQPRKFMSAARAASRLKPVIAIKSGRSVASARAASSHTGAMAGHDGVYDAAFRRAGIVRVDDLEELFAAVETLAYPARIDSDRLTIITNGGGPGILAADALIARGGKLAELTPDTVRRLDHVLPATWSHGNPVDIIGDAQGRRYADAMDILLSAPETDGVLAIHCPTAIASGTDAAQAVIDSAKKSAKSVLTNWLGGASASAPRSMFAKAAIPTFDTPTSAVRGFMHLVNFHRGQQTILEVPESVPREFSPDIATARAIIKRHLAEGKDWLDPVSVTQLLAAYGIRMPYCGFAATPDDAAKLAESRTAPLALKIVSPDVIHKSDQGGVALDLLGREMVLKAAQQMTARVTATNPPARVQGFLVQDMIRRPNAYELILGMTIDEQFGPVLLFGQGGTAAEIISDKALALPPLNTVLARELISRTRVYRQLLGYRNRAPASLEAIAKTVVKLSQLVCDLDNIIDIDINPLLADESGVIALDARIRISRTSGSRGNRLSIRPYPVELVQDAPVAGFGKARIRPIKPEDSSALEVFLTKLSPEDIRHRFFAPLREFGAGQLSRLTQIDYDREMALVLDAGGEGRVDILAVARLAADPDNDRAEFAVTVRSDVQRRGIGFLMLTRLIDYARARGLNELHGEILPDNVAMQQLCRKTGFVIQTEGARLVRAVLKLGA